MGKFYEHSEDLKEEFEDYGLEVFNEKPIRKVVLILEIFEDGDYYLSTMPNTGGRGNELVSGGDFNKDIKKEVMYIKDLFLERLKEIDDGK